MISAVVCTLFLDIPDPVTTNRGLVAPSEADCAIASQMGGRGGAKGEGLTPEFGPERFCGGHDSGRRSDPLGATR
ncbi:MAG: hypothetical protein ABSE20_29485, partial [Acetobacteraceae bacterium]